MSNYGDTPASGVVREATGSLLEKVQADVAHVVSAPATYYAYAYDRRLAEQRFADLDAESPSLLAFLRAASEAPDPRGLLLGGT